MQQIKFSFKFIPQKSKSQFIMTARKYVCLNLYVQSPVTEMLQAKC